PGVAPSPMAQIFLSPSSSSSAEWPSLASRSAGRPRQAAKYLSQAQWIVLQSPDCSAALQSKLHQGLGLFSIAEGNVDQALYHLANDVYLATAEFGLNSIEVSGGYFHMANIFFHQNQMDAADSLYTEVEEPLGQFWVYSLHKCSLRAVSVPAAEAQRERGARMLSALLELREQGPLQHLGETTQILHSLAIIHYLGQELASSSGVVLVLLFLSASPEPTAPQVLKPRAGVGYWDKSFPGRVGSPGTGAHSSCGCPWIPGSAQGQAGWGLQMSLPWGLRSAVKSFTSQTIPWLCVLHSIKADSPGGCVLVSARPLDPAVIHIFWVLPLSGLSWQCSCL
uniref:Zinc finger MYND domain-containing protein 12 n=1 Tax=Junco hyemalis TaxID=40217 RepID=A0A8C5INU3_JUNHY